jgi:hypothetical protein
VVLLISAVVASANLLTNPDFETGDLTGWEQSGWYVGGGADAHGGSYGAAYAVPAGRSAGDYYVALQYVPVTAGLSYDASMWSRAVIFNTSESFLEVVFHDNSGGWIGQTDTAATSSSVAYTQFQLSGLIAPAGAVTASVRAVVHTTGATADNAWHTFDDFNFDQTMIPEPGTLTLCLMGLGFGSVLMHRRRRNG